MLKHVGEGSQQGAGMAGGAEGGWSHARLNSLQQLLQGSDGQGVEQEPRHAVSLLPMPPWCNWLDGGGVGQGRCFQGPCCFDAWYGTIPLAWDGGRLQLNTHGLPQ